MDISNQNKVWLEMLDVHVNQKILFWTGAFRNKFHFEIEMSFRVIIISNTAHVHRRLDLRWAEMIFTALVCNDTFLHLNKLN